MQKRVSEFPEVKVVALDWDGTIVDSVPYKLAQNQAVAEAFGRHLSIDEVRKIWNESAGFDALMHNLTLSEDMDAIMAVVKSGYDDPRYAKRSFDFARPALEDLHERDYKLAVVTNATQQIVGMDAERLRFDIHREFDYVLTADMTEFKKPDGRVFDKVLGKFGIAAHELLYVGDEMKDCLAASNAGSHFIGVTTGMSTAEEFEAAGVAWTENIGKLV